MVLLGVVSSGGTCGLGLVGSGLEPVLREFFLERLLSGRLPPLSKRCVLLRPPALWPRLLEFFLERLSPGVCGLGCRAVLFGFRACGRPCLWSSSSSSLRCSAAARRAF